MTLMTRPGRPAIARRPAPSTRGLLALAVALLLGAGEARAGETGGCTPETAATWRRAADEALRWATEDYQHQRALDALSRLRRDLACLTTPVDQDSLGRVFLYEGAVRSALAQGEGPQAATESALARAAFSTAKVLFPHLAWDGRRLGSVGEAEFAAAVADLRSVPEDAVIGVPRAGPEVEVWVDGQRQVEGWSPEVPRRPGFHLVQVVDRAASSAVETHLIDLRAGERVVVAADLPSRARRGKESKTPRGRITAARPWLVGGAVVLGTGAALLALARVESGLAFDSVTQAEYDRHATANHALDIAGLAMGGTGVAFLGVGLGTALGAGPVRARDGPEVLGVVTIPLR